MASRLIYIQNPFAVGISGNRFMLHLSTISAYSSIVKSDGIVFSDIKSGTDANVALLDSGVTVAIAALLYAHFCILGSQFFVTSVPLFNKTTSRDECCIPILTVRTNP